MSTPQPDFRRGLRALDEALAQVPAPQTLSQPPWRQPASRRPAYVAGTVAAAMAVALFFVWSQPGPASAPVDQDVTQVVFSPGSCAPATMTARLTLARGCAIEVPDLGLVIQALADAQLEHSHRGFRVLQGDLQFHSSEVLDSAPVQVWVSQGRIEALGARFVVRQDSAGQGSVQAHKGRMRFEAPGQAPVVLRGGVTHRWRHSQPELPPARWSKARIDEEVAAASHARAEGDYDEARARLTKLLRAPVGEPVAEIMSFELGGLLENKIGDLAAACGHWRAQQRRFLSGQYTKPVGERLQNCPPGNSAGTQE